MTKNHNHAWWWKLWTAIILISVVVMSITFIIIYAFLIGFLSVPYTYYQDQIFETKIKERNVSKINNNNEAEYLLGQEGIDIFKQKIIKRLGFGPDFFALKEIIFTEGGELDLINDDSNALYYPSTQQIVLNTSKLINYFENNWEQRNNYYDDITELLFQVFYHEYGHHLANIYLINMQPNDQWASNKIYSNQIDGRKIEAWNKNFVNNFTNFLNYDTPTTKYDSANVTNKYGIQFKGNITYDSETKLNLPIKSIGSLYNSQELFEEANNQTHPKYQKVIDEFKNSSPVAYAFVPKESIFISPITLLDPIQLDYVAYIFCMQEIFTRKYMQLTFPYKTTQLIFDDGTFQASLENSNILNITTYLLDTLNYQAGFNNSNNMMFLNDAPLKDDDTANGLINLFFNHVGKNNSWVNNAASNTSANLSLLWTNNTSYYYADSWGVHANNADYQQTKFLKFGGFITDNQASAYKYVGYKDETGTFKAFEINVFDQITQPAPYDISYSYNRVDVLGGARQSVNNQPFYVIKDWINVDEVIDKQLYFSEDSTGNIINPLTSTLNQNLGPTWSKRFYNPLGLEFSVVPYLAKNQDGKITISNL